MCSNNAASMYPCERLHGHTWVPCKYQELYKEVCVTLLLCRMLILKKKNQNHRKTNVVVIRVSVNTWLYFVPLKVLWDFCSVGQSCYLVICPFNDIFTDPVIDYCHGLMKCFL